jgi:hypothetical protein
LKEIEEHWAMVQNPWISSWLTARDKISNTDLRARLGVFPGVGFVLSHEMAVDYAYAGLASPPAPNDMSGLVVSAARQGVLGLEWALLDKRQTSTAFQRLLANVTSGVISSEKAAIEFNPSLLYDFLTKMAVLNGALEKEWGNVAAW